LAVLVGTTWGTRGNERICVVSDFIVCMSHIFIPPSFTTPVLDIMSLSSLSYFHSSPFPAFVKNQSLWM